MRLAVDTNILISYYLNEYRADESRQFLQKIEDGNITGVLATYHSDSAAYIIEQQTDDLSHIRDHFSLIESSSIEEHTLSASEKKMATYFMEESKYALTFDDALLVYLAYKESDGNILTYDTDMNGLQMIQLYRPRDL